MEILDIAYFCLAQIEKNKVDIEQQKHMVYAQAQITSRFISTLFKKGVKVPSYEDCFGKPIVQNEIITKEDVANHLIERRNKLYGRTKTTIS